MNAIAINRTVGGMSSSVGWLRAWGPALAGGVALAIVTGSTGFISYTHICALTIQLHQSWKTAHLTPLCIDGQIVIGGLVLTKFDDRRKWWGLAGVIPGLAESLFANWESGIAHGYLSAAWAMVAAQSFATASFLFEKWIKAHVSQGGRHGPSGQPYIAANDQRDGGSDADACPHFLALTAEDAAIQAFLHARDCLDSALSQRQLAASFGLTRQRVAELVGPLNGSHAVPGSEVA